MSSPVYISVTKVGQQPLATSASTRRLFPEASALFHGHKLLLLLPQYLPYPRDLSELTRLGRRVVERLLHDRHCRARGGGLGTRESDSIVESHLFSVFYFWVLSTSLFLTDSKKKIIFLFFLSSLPPSNSIEMKMVPTSKHTHLDLRLRSSQTVVNKNAYKIASYDTSLFFNFVWRLEFLDLIMISEAEKRAANFKRGLKNLSLLIVIAERKRGEGERKCKNPRHVVDEFCHLPGKNAFLNQFKNIFARCFTWIKAG